MKNLPSTESVQKIIHSFMKMDSFLILRFGLFEYQLCYQYLEKCNGIRIKYSDFIKNHICMDAGIFYRNDEELDKYANYILLNLYEADIMAYWRNYPSKYIFDDFYKNGIKHINVNDLYPYPFWHEKFLPTWQNDLKNKKVLIVTSFAKTVKEQYLNRRQIWKEAEQILPEFQLLVYQAVCTHGGFKDSRFTNWIEAVEYMENNILKLEFDIALISCGGYGIPLAIKLKKRQKRVIQWGGCYQLWFGIKGNRWINDLQLKSYMNEYWVFPSIQETPPNASLINHSCYWKSVEKC
ncbi:MAG: hypothetical protein IKJ01_03720 [Lachnospiraceae bacterium]|nr:hypothetical protein [Lachnospiraceae bacterium]